MANWTTIVSRAVRSIALADTELLSDRDLLGRFADQGDQNAFAVLVKRHGPMVLGLCRRLLPQTQDAEDATQAVFILLARRAGRQKWDASVANWLFATARNVAWNALVTARRRVRRERTATPPETSSLLDTMTGRELLVGLDEELARLPARYREPLILCYLEGLSREAAATRLGVPEATLKSQLERGRKRLADALTARGYVPSALLLLVSAETGTASLGLVESILAGVSGTPTLAVTALLPGIAMHGIFAKTNILVALGVGILLMGLSLAGVQHSSAQQKTDPTKTSEQTLDARADTVVARIGSGRFRAEGSIAAARYTPDGKRIVGHAGSTIYVWDANDGSTLQKIDTRLDELTSPRSWGSPTYYFAVHPAGDRVACGGRRNGAVVLQLWDLTRGEMLAEKESRNGLDHLAWTPDGKWLAEKTRKDANRREGNELNVYDDRLNPVHSHALKDLYRLQILSFATLPDSKRVVLQPLEKLMVFDLKTGEAVHSFPFDGNKMSEMRISPDGKTLVVGSSEKITLLDLYTGNEIRTLPRPRQYQIPQFRFSADGKSLFVWDSYLSAYDTATGKAKWKVNAPNGVSDLRPQDVSPNGATLLVATGNALRRIETGTGAETDASGFPCHEADASWSPDGKTIFTRDHHSPSLTYTAWDVATGKRRYRLRPSETIAEDQWIMKSDLFFLSGGTELLADVQSWAPPKKNRDTREILVFDVESGRVKRRLGEELGKAFDDMHLIATNENGSRLAFQADQRSVDQVEERKYRVLVWDPVAKSDVREWTSIGHPIDTPILGLPRSSHHFAPYSLCLGVEYPESIDSPVTTRPCKLRYHSLDDGNVIREVDSDFFTLTPDRVQGDLLLTVGNNGGSVRAAKGSWSTVLPIPGYCHELWELASGERMKLFETTKRVDVVLGPGGKFLIRVRDDGNIEIVEPYLLKKPVLAVATPSQARRFEFSTDGDRVAVSLADTTVAVFDTRPWVKQIEDELRKHVPHDLAPLWDDLNKDVGTALRASRLLTLAEERAVALFAKKVIPQSAPDTEEVKKLLDELGSPRFATRQRAANRLRGLAYQIEPHLREALKAAPSADVKLQLDALLREIESNKLSPEELRLVRAAAVLKQMGCKGAKGLLAKWAASDPSSPLAKTAKK